MGHGVVTSALLQYLSLVVMVLALFHQTLAHLADWYETLPYEEMGTPKMTRLHFYFHYVVTRGNPSVALVAQPLSIYPPLAEPSVYPFPFRFGQLFMIDNPLTEGPELTSKLVGRAQGLVGLAGLNEAVSIMALSFVFTDEKFNGSTLSILDRESTLLNPVRELAVVGGTGVFRFARGFLVSRTFFYNETTQDATFEHDVFVVHY